MINLAGKYTIDPISGCWNWKKGFLRTGYGQIHFGYESLRAHRVSYEQSKGSIPEGHDVHHKCENKKCINPDHLEAVKHNLHKSLHKKLKCKRGHFLTEDNVYIGNDGRRRCKFCALERSARQIHF